MPFKSLDKEIFQLFLIITPIDLNQFSSEFMPFKPLDKEIFQLFLIITPIPRFQKA